MGCVCNMGRPSKDIILRNQRRLFKLERLPDYLRDTVDWFIRSPNMSALATRQVSMARRPSSDEIDAAGCCPAKIFISGLVNFATRSRRKDVKEPKSKRMHSTSAVPHRIGKKSQSTELCVCDSIDDKMIEKFTSLPYGIDQQEWLAAHTLSLFDHVNALCGSISELCTPVTCPSMNFPGTSKAYHTDEKGKRHLYSAMQYMDCVMSFCEQSSRNEDIFPTKYGNTFSEEFEPHIRRVVRLLWHCCGHLYIKHWDELGQLELRPQFSLVLAHMTTLSKTFNLLDEKDQRVIEDTVVAIRPPLMHGALLSDEGGGASSQPRYTRVPSSKSGSWGGHPTPAVLSCKPYAQTC